MKLSCVNARHKWPAGRIAHEQLSNELLSSKQAASTRAHLRRDANAVAQSRNLSRRDIQQVRWELLLSHANRRAGRASADAQCLQERTAADRDESACSISKLVKRRTDNMQAKHTPPKRLAWALQDVLIGPRAQGSPKLLAVLMTHADRAASCRSSCQHFQNTADLWLRSHGMTGMPKTLYDRLTV